MIDGQVPNTTYLIVGDGNMASHWAHWLELLGIRDVDLWSRKASNHPIEELTTQYEHIFLAISDDALASMIDKISQNAHLSSKIYHFSGAQHFEGATQIHPLMTFSNELYDIETYQSIHFCSSDLDFQLSSINPNFTNPLHFIDKKQLPLYHALCVLAGNGLNVLISSVLSKVQTELNIPADAFERYLERSLSNALKHQTKSLTGPWVRGDHKTIAQHQKALAADSLIGLYNKLNAQFSKRTSL